MPSPTTSCRLDLGAGKYIVRCEDYAFFNGSIPFVPTLRDDALLVGVRVVTLISDSSVLPRPTAGRRALDAKTVVRIHGEERIPR